MALESPIHACNEIGLLLASDTRRGEVASALRAALSVPGTPRLEVLTWDQVLVMARE